VISRAAGAAASNFNSYWDIPQRVLLLDKHDFPRDKVCGGGISNKTVGLLAPHFDISPVIQQHMTGAFLTYQNQGTVEKALPGRGGASVLRSEFDFLIVKQAIAQGVTFVPKAAFKSAVQSDEEVAVTATTGTYRVKHLVGADGVFSEVRRAIFGPDLVTYAPAVEALVTVSPDVHERFRGRVLFDFGGMPNGYGWIFPKRDHLNVGVFSIYKSNEAQIKTMLKSFMGLYRSLDAPLQVIEKGSCIPLRNTRGLYQRRRVLLVGDAAGFAESVYGEGIYFALSSALVAASAIGKGAAAEEVAGYQEALKSSHLLTDMRYSELNAGLVFRAPKRSFDLMVRNESVNHLFAELIAGGVGHKECFFRTLLTSPRWLLFPRRLPPLDVQL